MRNEIREFIEYTEEEKKALWNTAIFIFDTNVLLNLYRYSKDTRNALIDAIRAKKDNIWIPYQVALEFMNNRCKVIYEAKDRYSKLLDDSNGFLKKCCGILRLSSDDSSILKLSDCLQDWIAEQKECNGLNISLTDDYILDEILDLFDSKIGSKYDEEKLIEIYAEGKIRYEKKVPPGYKDADNKSANYEFGDLILWHQIIDYARDKDKDIVLVIHDRKEDWWNIICGETVGPRIELRKELWDKTGHRFHTYNMHGFIKYSNYYAGTSASQKIIDEITNVERKYNNQTLIDAKIHNDKELLDYEKQYAYIQMLFGKNPRELVSYYNEASKIMDKIVRSKSHLNHLQQKYASQEIIPDKIKLQQANTYNNLNQNWSKLNNIYHKMIDHLD